MTDKKWRDKNKDRIKGYSLKYRAKFKEHIKKYRKDYYGDREKFKQKAVDYKGGKCSSCGYNKCNEALDFHHLDPTKKDFGLGNKIDIMMRRNEGSKEELWETIQAELDKCILLCSNCHRELHWKIKHGV